MPSPITAPRALPRLPIVLAAALLLGVAGCDSGSTLPQAVPSGVMSATAAAMPPPVFAAGRLVLPAVPGNPGAAYFTLANSGDLPITLTGVVIAGATGAEMHESTATAMRRLTTVVVPANSVAAFQPGGKHVMVFGLTPTLEIGRKTDITLTLADGRVVKGSLTIDPPGDPAADTQTSGTMTMPDSGPMKM